MVHCKIQVVTGYNFQIKLQFVSIMIIFVLVNSVYPDEMPNYVPFNLGLLCMQW